jgi:hypothetical protein
VDRVSKVNGLRAALGSMAIGTSTLVDLEEGLWWCWKKQQSCRDVRGFRWFGGLRLQLAFLLLMESLSEVERLAIYSHFCDH